MVALFIPKCATKYVDNSKNPIEPIWELFTKGKVQYPSGFYGYYSH